MGTLNSGVATDGVSGATETELWTWQSFVYRIAHNQRQFSHYENPRSGKLQVPMNRHTALLALAVFIAFAAVQTSASTPAPTLPGMKNPRLRPGRSLSSSLRLPPPPTRATCSL
jgi:hypothetical protein